MVNPKNEMCIIMSVTSCNYSRWQKLFVFFRHGLHRNPCVFSVFWWFKWIVWAIVFGRKRNPIMLLCIYSFYVNWLCLHFNHTSHTHSHSNPLYWGWTEKLARFFLIIYFSKVFIPNLERGNVSFFCCTEKWAYASWNTERHKKGKKIGCQSSYVELQFFFVK